MQRTATRFTITLSMIKTLRLRLALAPGSRRRSCLVRSMVRSMKTLVVVLVLFAQSAFALIGESEKQIEARYGRPKKVGPWGRGGQDRVISYAAHGFAIDVGFVAGISRAEAFYLLDKSPITEDAVKRVLAISANKGQTWESVPPAPNGPPTWHRSDGKVMAISTGQFVNVNGITVVKPE